jgi:hypothetical protein
MAKVCAEEGNGRSNVLPREAHDGAAQRLLY